MIQALVLATLLTKPIMPEAIVLPYADKIERTYAASEMMAYKLDIDIASQKAHLTATIHWAVTKTTPTGATVNLKVTDAVGSDDKGKSQALPPVTPADWGFGRNGMSSEATMQGDRFPFALLCFVSYLPGDLSKSKAFKIDWTSIDKSTSMNGTGSYEGLQDVDGKSAAVIKTNSKITSGNPSQTAHMTNTSYMDPATGMLIKSEGTLLIGTDAANFTIKTVK